MMASILEVGNASRTGQCWVAAVNEPSDASDKPNETVRHQTESPLRQVRGTLVAVLSVFVLDALILGQGGITLFATPIIFIIAIGVGIARKDRLLIGALRAVLPLLMFVAVAGTVMLHLKHAEAASKAVISACEAFAKDQGRFPEKLEELTPKYLHSIPRARYTVFFGGFTYQAEPQEHTLGWITIPPFGRRYYVFEDKRDFSLD